jgi:hypothetical protein
MVVNQVFDVPGDDQDEVDDLSTSVPLLRDGEGSARRPEDDELEELMEAEGPKMGERGTMMDGIANVRP